MLQRRTMLVSALAVGLIALSPASSQAQPQDGMAGARLGAPTAAELDAGVERPHGPRTDAGTARRDWAARVAAQARADGAASDNLGDLSDKAAQPMDAAGTVQSRGNCTPTDLAPGQTNGQLSDGDCRWGQLTGVADISWVDVYRVRLAERGRVSLTASSPDFDVLLTLRDARYGQIDAASAPAAAAAATLDNVLPAGTYYLLLTNGTAGGAVPGAYRLNATLSPDDAPSGCTAQPLPSGGVPAGNLGASGCRGYDFFPHRWWTGDAALYEAVMAEPGVLSLDVAASGHVPPRIVVLTRTGLTLINATFPEGGANPSDVTHLAVALPKGTFYVLVYADAPDQAGAFSLQSAVVSAAAACRPVAAPLGVEIAATLDAGCRQAHLNNGVYFDNAVDLYEVTVPQEGQLTFGLKTTGADFIGLLFLYDGQNRPVIDGPLPDGYVAAPPPGVYHVAVAAATHDLGSYTLRFDFVPDGRACQVQPLVFGTPVDGTIDANDCGFKEFISTVPYEQGVDVYMMDVPARGEVDLAMSATAMDAYVAVFGGPTVEGNRLVYFVASHDDIDPLRNTNARLRLPLSPGRYFVVALSAATEPGKQTGTYRLDPRFTPAAAPNCDVATLAPNVQLSAELSGNECRVFDRDPTRLSASLQDRYRIDLPSAGVLTILMNAPSFSPRVQLAFGPYLDPIGADADPRLQGHDAMLQFVAEAGTYWLDAEEAGGGRTATGAYVLRTQFVPRPVCNMITDLDPLPADRTGEIVADDCLLGDPPLLAQEPTPTDYYRFTLTEIGALTIDLESTAIDPALYLINARWSILAANANIDETDQNSQLRLAAVAPGTYYVAAISTDPAGRGAYRLRVSFTPAALVVPTPGVPTASPTATPGLEPTPTPRPGVAGKIYLPLTLRLSDLRAVRPPR